MVRMALTGYLVRHGQSEWNVRGLVQGQTPHPDLTDLGRQEAHTAADRIAADLAERGLMADCVLCSDLRRASATAEIIASRLQIPVTQDARLRERSFGWLEGRTTAERATVEQAHDWSDPTLPFAGGESLQDVHDRMAEVLRGLPTDRVTVLVSHGDAIRRAVAFLTGVAPQQARGIEVRNGAVVRFDATVTWL